MQTAPALRLHSIMLGVQDLDRSVTFYTDNVGMNLRGRSLSLAFLNTGDVTITLNTQLSRARQTAAPFPIEIVLSVDSVRDAYERLRSRSVPFLNEPHTVDGTNDVANFEDPDGHVFSLFGPP